MSVWSWVTGGALFVAGNVFAWALCVAAARGDRARHTLELERRDDAIGQLKFENRRLRQRADRVRHPGDGAA